MDAGNHSGVPPPENRVPEPRALPRMAAMLPAALASLRRRPEAGAQQPLRASFRLAGVAPAAVARYRRLVGEGCDGLPLTYFYLLAQRAQLAVMVADGYPYAVPGMVHVGNALRRHQPPQADRPYSVGVAVDFRTDEQQREWAAVEVAFEQNGRLVASCHSDYRAVRRSGERRPQARAGCCRGPTAAGKTGRSTHAPAGATRACPATTTRFTCPAGWRGCSASAGRSCRACMHRRAPLRSSKGTRSDR